MVPSLTGRPASFAGVALAAVFLWACGDTGETVRLGVAGPLDQVLGAHTLRGTQLARDQINAAGGIDGAPLELVAVNDSADAGRAVSVAAEFFSDPSLVAVIGHSNSGALLAAASVYERGLPAISATATSPEITEAGRWIFRVAPSDAATSEGLARFALRHLGDRAVMLYANDAFGRGLREAFGAAYVAGGGELVREYPYIEWDTEDFALYLEAARPARPDLIFVAGLDHGGGRIVRQARRLGIEAPILGGDGLLGLVGRDPIYDGTYVLVHYHPDAPGQANREFVEAYRAAYGDAPDAYAALAYDAVRLVTQAMREVGPDRARIRDYLEEVGSERPAFVGVSGAIAFDEHGDPIEKSVGVGRIRGAGIELISVEDGS